ncbi:DUF6493 family protein [Streptomyces solicathayae]|uniref:DUF6493 family protein n=1 Tax=Streptomyces solicathayae TaxID=3081768 RepID=A0ABZ0M1T2_9ACTN|nr:DUF6493 family protein [Streptomyces sp. HUAS YS2]WOX25677.1 DUF6493 family protein [Streptomyces sp. HUAS YS2]
MITSRNPSKQLLKNVRAGRTADVPALLKVLDATERKALLIELKAVRAELRGGTRWDGAWRRVVQALRVAGVGCQTGAAAAATWLAARDMEDWGGESHAATVEVLADRAPAWLGNLAQRLADRRGFVEFEFGLVQELVLRSGGEVPATDAYVAGWTGSLDHANLAEQLRAHPHTRLLVRRLFELTETPGPLSRNTARWDVEPATHTSWLEALDLLTTEGVLDRRDLLEGCLARLVRGGRPHDLRFHLALLQRLAPTQEELQAHTADLLGMAADGPSTVAGYAQEALAVQVLAGELPDSLLAEMSGALLFRTEKKLVRAQLTLLGKVLKQRPTVAPELLPLVAEAFGHADSDVQLRALKLVGAHLNAVDEAVREGLAGSAELLSAVHRPSAVELFGTTLSAEPDLPYEEFLPPVPERRRLAPAADTLPELVEELVPLVTGRRQPAPEDFERALDGLVRYAAQDREALAEGVRGLVADSWWMNESIPRSTAYFQGSARGVEAVLAALFGKVTKELIDAGRARQHLHPDCTRHVLEAALEQRLWELADLIGTPALPFLVATPTWHTGAVDAAELVERLRRYRDAGLEPAPADFAQALLRVRRTGPEAAEAARAAADLGTAAGDRLVEWLADAAPLDPVMQIKPPVEKRANGYLYWSERIDLTGCARPGLRQDFPGAFRWLVQPFDGQPVSCRLWVHEREHLPLVLPVDREALATWLLPRLVAGVEWGERGATWWLPAFAEAEGELGAAGALALACGMASPHAADRLSAVDALLVLAARRDLDAAAVGTALAGLVQDGFAKPNRVADATRTAAATGAFATVWSVLAALLPALLEAERSVRGLGDLLAVAAECVEQCRAGGALAGLDRVAARGGSSQAVVQAKRLLIALAQGTDQTATQLAKNSQ